MKRILVVDDDEALRQLYKSELESEGYEVILAEDGQSALEQFEKSQPELMILDIVMPNMNGMEVLARIARGPKRVPVIVNTAYASHKNDLSCWGVDAYVTKSPDLGELKAKVKELLARYEQWLSRKEFTRMQALRSTRPDVRDMEGKDDLLMTALKYRRDARVRWHAAGALGEMRDTRAVEPLIHALKDESPYVRFTTAKALGEMGDPRAVEPLIEALKDKDGKVRESAGKALAKIKAKEKSK